MLGFEDDGLVEGKVMIQAPTQSPSTRQALPKALWVTWCISFLLLGGVGSTLFCFPAIAQAYWPWVLSPFNTRLLGAVYLSASIPLLGYLIRPSLGFLRVILPIFAIFTTYFLLVSMGHQASFLARKSAVIWFFLYGADSFVGLFYCWRLRQHLRISRRHFFRWSLLSLQALLLGIYGLGLLLIAPLFGSWWLWPLDAFHSHLYSGVFLTAAITLLLGQHHFLSDKPSMGMSPSPSKIVPGVFGITQLFLGVAIACGNGIVDAQVNKLNWASASPWVWQAIFLLFAAFGGWMLVKADLFQTKT